MMSQVSNQLRFSMKCPQFVVWFFHQQIFLLVTLYVRGSKLRNFCICLFLFVYIELRKCKSKYIQEKFDLLRYYLSLRLQINLLQSKNTFFAPSTLQVAKATHETEKKDPEVDQIINVKSVSIHRSSIKMGNRLLHYLHTMNECYTSHIVPFSTRQILLEVLPILEFKEFKILKILDL